MVGTIENLRVPIILEKISSINFPKKIEKEIEKVLLKHGDFSRESVLRLAISVTDPDFIAEHDDVSDDYYVLGWLLRNYLNENASKFWPQTHQPSKTRISKKLSVKDRTELLNYTTVLIDALGHALAYDRKLHHNNPPPEMWMDDTIYLQELRSLLTELQEIRSVLQQPKTSRAKVNIPITRFTKHFDKFLSSYASAVGKVMAGLTSATIVGLLYKSGIGQDFIASIWGHLKFPK